MANTGVPILTIPESGPILARPRKEGVYDTEGWSSSGAVAAKISIFRDSTRFVEANLDLTKRNPRDTNMDQQIGLAGGQHLHWYYTKNKIRPLGHNLFNANYITVLDEIRRIRESNWFTFYFGGSGKGQLFTVQLWQVPEGSGTPRPFTTNNATTCIDGSQAELDRANVYDVTMNGVPVEIVQEETFSVDIENNGVSVTPTVDLYDTVILGGYFLRGIQG